MDGGCEWVGGGLVMDCFIAVGISIIIIIIIFNDMFELKKVIMVEAKQNMFHFSIKMENFSSLKCM